MQPPKKKRKRSTKKKPKAKIDEETEGSVRKEVKDLFEKAKKEENKKNWRPKKWRS
jgi:hypothetical protein